MYLEDYIDSLFHGAIWFTILSCVLGIAIYLCKAVGLYELAKNAGQKNPWLAFIPVVQDMKVFNLAGFSSKLYILFYVVYRALYSGYVEGGIFCLFAWIGVAFNAVVLAYARYIMAKNFGATQAVCILNIFFEPFVLLYLMAKKLPHNYYPIHPNVEKILKQVNLYENPHAFVDANTNTQNDNSWYQPQNPEWQPPQKDFNGQWSPAHPYQNPESVQVPVQEEKQNPIELNIEK